MDVQNDKRIVENERSGVNQVVGEGGVRNADEAIAGQNQSVSTQTFQHKLAWKSQLAVECHEIVRQPRIDLCI